MTIAVADAPEPKNCSFSYTAATTKQAPVIGPDVSSGC
jgi:hypothetical protein